MGPGRRVWQLVYVLQAGLHLNEPDNVPGYPAPTFTTGLRNMTGRVNRDGTVTQGNRVKMSDDEYLASLVAV